MSAQALLDALLAVGDPHTFRDGSVLATVGGFSAQGSTLTVESVSATIDGVAVAVDLPYLVVDPPAVDDPLLLAHQAIADMVRWNHGA